MGRRGTAGPEGKPREHRSKGESRKGSFFLWGVWEVGEATSDKVARKAFLSRERTECSRHRLCKGPVAEPRLCVWGAESERGRGRWSRRLWACGSIGAGLEMGAGEAAWSDSGAHGRPWWLCEEQAWAKFQSPETRVEAFVRVQRWMRGVAWGTRRVRRGWLVAMFTGWWTDHFRRLLFCWQRQMVSLEDDVAWAAASSPVPPRNLPPVTQRQEEHFLPRPLTCPQPSLRPPHPKHCWWLQPRRRLPICQSFVLYIYFSGRQNRLQTAPTGGSWVAFFSFFTREGERQTSWGICPLRESLSCSPSRHAPPRREWWRDMKPES